MAIQRWDQHLAPASSSKVYITSLYAVCDATLSCTIPSLLTYRCTVSINWPFSSCHQNLQVSVRETKLGVPFQKLSNTLNKKSRIFLNYNYITLADTSVTHIVMNMIIAWMAGWSTYRAISASISFKRSSPDLAAMLKIEHIGHRSLKWFQKKLINSYQLTKDCEYKFDNRQH